MGLDNFNVAPDNKGGRKKEEEKEKKSRESPHEEPYTRGHGEEYWEDLWNQYNTDDRTLNEVIAKIGEHSALLGRTVVNKLQDDDVVDFHELDTENEFILEYLDTRERKTKSSSSSTTFSSDDSGSGLAGLVNNAK